MHAPATSTVLFVGGGTGGHLKPGLVLLDALRRRHPDWRLRILVSGRAVERRFLHPDDADGPRVLPHEVVEMFPGCKSRPALWRLDRYMGGLARARAATAIQGHRPDLMVLMGGYVSAIAVLAAPRVDTVLLEPDCIPGKAARLAERRARRIFDQWPDTRGRPECTARRMVTGMPISWSTLPDRVAARRRLGLDPSRTTLVVVGGSQGAQAVNRAVAHHLDGFRGAPPLQCLHLAGPQDRAWVEQAYRDAGIPSRVVDFHTRMEEVYAAADLVVARAGGMTVAELAAAGRAAVLIPYPHHRDHHQDANARVLANADAAWIVPESETGTDFVSRRLVPLLENRTELRRREENAARLGRPDATQRIVDEIEALVWRRGKECKNVGDGFISSGLAEVG